MRTCFLLLTAIVTMIASSVQADVRFGVVAPRGELNAKARWEPLAQHLSTVMGETVTLVPSSPNGGLKQLESGAVDAYLGNPVQAAIARETMGARLLVSLERSTGSQFGGVIVARSGSGISTADDLKGRKVISLKSAAAGGFIFQAAHLVEAGLQVLDDFARHKVGKNQEDLVKLVIKGVFDAAFVRTGILEAMAANGEIDLDALVVIDERRGEEGGLRRSTRL